VAVLRVEKLRDFHLCLMIAELTGQGTAAGGLLDVSESHWRRWAVAGRTMFFSATPGGLPWLWAIARATKEAAWVNATSSKLTSPTAQSNPI
jgi:hypothetical protein